MYTPVNARSRTSTATVEASPSPSQTELAPPSSSATASGPASVPSPVTSTRWHTSHPPATPTKGVRPRTKGGRPGKPP